MLGIYLVLKVNKHLYTHFSIQTSAINDFSVYVSGFILIVNVNKSYSYITEFDDKDYNFTHADLLPYIWAYLEEKYKFLGENPENITEKEVDRLHCLMKKMWIVSEVYIQKYNK